MKRIILIITCLMLISYPLLFQVQKAQAAGKAVTWLASAGASKAVIYIGKDKALKLARHLGTKKVADDVVERAIKHKDYDLVFDADKNQYWQLRKNLDSIGDIDGGSIGKSFDDIFEKNFMKAINAQPSATWDKWLNALTDYRLWIGAGTLALSYAEGDKFDELLASVTLESMQEAGLMMPVAFLPAEIDWRPTDFEATYEYSFEGWNVKAEKVEDYSGTMLPRTLVSENFTDYFGNTEVDEGWSYTVTHNYYENRLLVPHENWYVDLNFGTMLQSQYYRGYDPLWPGWWEVGYWQYDPIDTLEIRFNDYVGIGMTRNGVQFKNVSAGTPGVTTMYKTETGREDLFVTAQSGDIGQADGRHYAGFRAPPGYFDGETMEFEDFLEINNIMYISYSHEYNANLQEYVTTVYYPYIDEYNQTRGDITIQFASPQNYHLKYMGAMTDVTINIDGSERIEGNIPAAPDTYKKEQVVYPTFDHNQMGVSEHSDTQPFQTTVPTVQVPEVPILNNMPYESPTQIIVPKPNTIPIKQGETELEIEPTPEGEDILIRNPNTGEVVDPTVPDSGVGLEPIPIDDDESTIPVKQPDGTVVQQPIDSTTPEPVPENDSTPAPPGTEPGTEEEPLQACERPFKFPKLEPLGNAMSNNFPFSIPWDIERAIDHAFGKMGSERPEFDMVIPFQGKEEVWTISMPEYFDNWVPFTRTLLIFIFDVGLVYGIIRLMPGGNG